MVTHRSTEDDLEPGPQESHTNQFVADNSLQPEEDDQPAIPTAGIENEGNPLGWSSPSAAFPYQYEDITPLDEEGSQSTVPLLVAATEGDLQNEPSSDHGFGNHPESGSAMLRRCPYTSLRWSRYSAALSTRRRIICLRPIRPPCT